MLLCKRDGTGMFLDAYFVHNTSKEIVEGDSAYLVGHIEDSILD